MTDSLNRQAYVFLHGIFAGTLSEHRESGEYSFEYSLDYQGPPVSFTLPISKRRYSFKTFPAFFDGLLPEGVMLESLLRARKLDAQDRFGQLLAIGGDLMGAVEVRGVR